MPGKKGVKLMPRLSKSGKWNSVKELVFHLLETNPNIRKQDVDAEVRKEYPNAKFLSNGGGKGHFPWYKHQFLRKKLEEASFNIKEPAKDASKQEPKTDETDISVAAPKPAKATTASVAKKPTKASPPKKVKAK